MEDGESTKSDLFIFPSDSELFPDRNLAEQIDRCSELVSGGML